MDVQYVEQAATVVQVRESHLIKVVVHIPMVLACVGSPIVWLEQVGVSRKAKEGGPKDLGAWVHVLRGSSQFH